MLRRVACIFLPEVRLELARSKEQLASLGVAAPPIGPIAAVIARPGGAVKLERDVLGSTRIDVVSSEARALGVRAGQTVAAARANVALRAGGAYAELSVRVVAEEDVQAALARVAEAALSFGPTAGFDAAQDVVWVDVGGCAHLRGGEIELARALEACVRQLGHGCRIAIADGPRVAAAVARFGRAPRGPTVVVIPAGKSAAAMRVLPVAALGLDPEATVWLRDLGVRTCADLQRLPRRSLGTRLAAANAGRARDRHGASVLDVMQLLDGDDRAPLVAWRPPEVPEERVSVDWGVRSRDARAFVVKTLCDRRAARLEKRAMAAVRLELVLVLDRTLCGSGQDSSTSLHVVLPMPVVRAEDLLAVLRARLENFAMAGPALSVTLRAPELARQESRPLDLLVPEPKAQRALPLLVAELGAELGLHCVGTLGLVDTWVPEQRTKLVPFGANPGGCTRHPLLTAALEPTRMTKPSRLELGALGHMSSHVRLLGRIEGVGWWRRGGSGSTTSQKIRRVPEGFDLAAAWIGSKHEGGLAWVELYKDEARLRGWID